MHLALLILLGLPFSSALECLVGDSYGDSGGFQPIQCEDKAKYCYTMDSFSVGPHSISKSCDPGSMCKNVGTFDINGGKLHCCTGDDCNEEIPTPNPDSTALECLVGDSYGDSGGFQPIRCEDKAKYCYTMDSYSVGPHSISKSCDPGSMCKSAGTFDINGGKLYCCTGNDCNDDKIVTTTTAKPISTTLECLSGTTTNNIGVFEPVQCEYAKYCCTMDTLSVGMRTVHKTCDPGYTCKGVGTFDIPGGKLYCCTGDDCNDFKMATPTPAKPGSTALECLVGTAAGNIGRFEPIQCEETAKYCYTMDIPTEGLPETVKGCDPGDICKFGVGKFDYQEGKLYCCTGNDCNDDKVSTATPHIPSVDTSTPAKPVSALECVVGSSISGIGIFEPIHCSSKAQYCYTIVVSVLGVLSVTRDCDPALLCKDVGVFDRPDGTLSCCKGNDCNTDDNLGLPLECLVGESINDIGSFIPEHCRFEDEYCYTMDVTIDGVHSVSKSCDRGFVCKGEGSVDQTGGSLYCCKDNDCNSASGISLLMTILAGIAAIWQRI